MNRWKVFFSTKAGFLISARFRTGKTWNLEVFYTSIDMIPFDATCAG